MPEPKTVFWAFDVLSPYSYLSLKQLRELPELATVKPVPVLFASLLKHHGTTGNAELASKRLFTYRFCLWRARRLGIELRFPPSHPFNPLMALRLIIAAGSSLRATQAVFDAVWRDGQDVSRPEVIADLARALGIPDAERRINDPTVKRQLHDNAAWALAHGAFGVPSFIVDQELFWGHDAFEMVVDYLRDPQLFEDAEMRRLPALPFGAARKFDR